MSADNENTENYKVIYISENGRCQIVRHYFKQSTEKINEELSVEMDEEYNEKLSEVNKSERLTELNQNMLQTLKNQRKQTEAVGHQTISRCKSLLQQMELPARDVEEMRSTEKSMKSLLQQLKK